MGEDEKGTGRTLNAYKELMAGLIQHHHGRVVDASGDNLLTEFASAVDTVQCAVDIQEELETRNADRGINNFGKIMGTSEDATGSYADPPKGYDRPPPL
jgi:class 3 adenylate cyclase